MTEADVCIIGEAGYPYTLGGVSSWTDAFIRAAPERTFHVVSLTISSQPREQKFELPPNVCGVSDILLDVCAQGARPKRRHAQTIEYMVMLIEDALTHASEDRFREFLRLLHESNLVGAALLDSKPAWLAMEQVYQRALPTGPLVEFFWSWRFLARSLLAVAAAPVPPAKVYHSVATGYAGLFGACAKVMTGRPFALTEHGIYTNERRIELSVGDWIFESGAGGYEVRNRPIELRSLWQAAFQGFSRLAYDQADVITTQYTANQTYQLADGAVENKFHIIPNGIDADRFAAIEHSRMPRRPTVIMIGRIVPIKDTRTFIMAVAHLRELVPDVSAVLIGPEDEDPAYAAGCRQLVEQLRIGDNISFLGRVPDVFDYLRASDVLVLTSISEAQPIALLEAAAMGLPTVSTDVGSCRELIEGFDADPVVGHGGIVVDVCNPRATAEALAKILLNPELKAQMGDVMRRRAANRYHKDRVSGLYSEVYTRLISQMMAEAGV